MALALLPEQIRLPKSVPLSPNVENGQNLCKLCDIHDWNEPGFRKLASEILGGDFGYAPEHRKVWEFVKVVQALQAFNLFNERSFGLSVAAGVERILFYLCKQTGRLVATDIYGIGNFAKLEADQKFLSAPESFAPYAYPRERLLPLFMNGLELKFPENTFDFAFSLSSIEHFGGIKRAEAAISEMGRVVRPGGVVIVTTECSVNGYTLREVFSPREIQQLFEMSGLRLVQQFDWSLNADNFQHVLDFRKDDLNVTPHILLKAFGSAFTSICLVFQKEGPQNGIRELKTAAELDRLVAELRKLPREFSSDLDRRPIRTRVLGRMHSIRECLQEKWERWRG